MDCHPARVWSRFCFGKIKEIFNLCRAHIEFSERGWGVGLWRYVQWWTHFLNLNGWPMVWGYHSISANAEDPYSPLARWTTTITSRLQELPHSGQYFVPPWSIFPFTTLLTHDEANVVLNDCHGGACGGHLSGISIAQKILRAGYFWPSIFKDCIEVVKRCHPCQVFSHNMHSKPAPLHPIITVGPFTKWGLDFMDCNPASAGGPPSYHSGYRLLKKMGWGNAYSKIRRWDSRALRIQPNHL